MRGVMKVRPPPSRGPANGVVRTVVGLSLSGAAVYSYVLPLNSEKLVLAASGHLFLHSVLFLQPHPMDNPCPSYDLSLSLYIYIYNT